MQRSVELDAQTRALAVIDPRRIPRSTWDEILGSVGQLRVAVVGDFCLDVYWHLSESDSAYSLETGKPVNEVLAVQYGLGGAGNVVANLAALGVEEIRAIGLCGADPFGAIMAGMLAGYADTSALVNPGPEWNTATYVKPVLGGEEQPRFDILSPSEISNNFLDQLQEAIAGAASWANVMLVNQQVIGPLRAPELATSINATAEANPNLKLLVDARDEGHSYPDAIRKINLTEAARWLNVSEHDETAVLAAAEAAVVRGAGDVFVTLGSGGIAVVTSSGVSIAPAAALIGPIDPVGAGDTVLASVGVALGTGAEPHEAATLANIAASITVQKLGATGTASPAELQKSFIDVEYRYSVHLARRSDRDRTIDDTEIEVVERLGDRPPVRHAVFDHDGTISTLRAGWEEIMADMMEAAIIGDAIVGPQLRADIGESVRRLIQNTTGAPTVRQMEGLVGLVSTFGLVKSSDRLRAEDYKELYVGQLAHVVERRRSRVTRGELSGEDFQVKGASQFLQELIRQQVELYLASGTDVGDVLEDATRLGHASHFGQHIYGAGSFDDLDAKRVVISDVVARSSEEVSTVVFGDGPVEMREARRAGAIAVGVCSDEIRRFGFNQAKRRQLIEGGAHLLIPDYSYFGPVLKQLGLGPGLNVSKSDE